MVLARFFRGFHHQELLNEPSEPRTVVDRGVNAYTAGGLIHGCGFRISFHCYHCCTSENLWDQTRDQLVQVDFPIKAPGEAMHPMSLQENCLKRKCNHATASP